MPNDLRVISAFEGEYGFLSNFYRLDPPIHMEGFWFNTSEAAFQAMKTLDLGYREAVSLAPSPGTAKRMGRTFPLRHDWEECKEFYMTQALNEKFKDPHLRYLLINTRDCYLIEGNNWNDTYWGFFRGEGKNRLGHLLMELRANIRRGTLT